MKGIDILHDARLNKATAFTKAEREEYGLVGLLPPAICTQESQMARALENLRRKAYDVERFIFLQALQARNERLFYRLLVEHIEELMPIVYTPTVGQACQEFAHIFRQTRGLYISAQDRGTVRKILRNWPSPDVKVIVITDGERILGLGDLGANGMGIPIGKLSLYTALAGIAPEHTLPIMLDVGTDNLELRNDPLYLGLNQSRLRGEQYLELVDELVQDLNDEFENCLIQFEDFATPNAFVLLERYRESCLCFNDDIQGTAAVVLAGIYASCRLTGTEFRDLRIMFLGAGSAATGIGDLLVEALKKAGLDGDVARQRLWFVDEDGLLIAERTSELMPHNIPYVQDFGSMSFLQAIDSAAPQILIGATGAPGSFTRAAIERMTHHNVRPVIFALSNPTDKAECTAAEAYQWSDGRAIFSSGSPFDPVEYKGQEFITGQGNNAYIFPGIGLGCTAVQAKGIPSSVFLESARCLANQVTDNQLRSGSLYPPLTSLRDVSFEIAVAVASEVQQLGLCAHGKTSDIKSVIREMLYDPAY